jgi:hypothetical protein
MNTHTIKFAYDGEAQTAVVEEINQNDELQFQVTPTNKKLEDKFGKTIFTRKKGEPLSGSPINDLEYFSALKEGLEDYLLQAKKI